MFKNNNLCEYARIVLDIYYKTRNFNKFILDMGHNVLQ